MPSPERIAFSHEGYQKHFLVLSIHVFYACESPWCDVALRGAPSDVWNVLRLIKKKKKKPIRLSQEFRIK